MASLGLLSTLSWKALKEVQAKPKGVRRTEDEGCISLLSLISTIIPVQSAPSTWPKIMVSFSLMYLAGLNLKTP